MVIDDHEFERARFESADRAMLRNAGFLLHETYQGILYFLSFLPLVLLLSYFRRAHPAVLLGLLIAGFYLAGIVFLSLLIVTKKIVIGNLVTDQVVTVHTRLGKQFFIASLLHSMMNASPFRSLVCGLSPLMSYYYRGMGAKLAATVFISSNAKIFDPWFVEIHENVTIGSEAVISGHLGDGPRIILGTVFIGEGAIIGARSVVLPDVRVGRHARLGVGAVAVRGTIIPDGETWAGVPARKISGGIREAASTSR